MEQAGGAASASDAYARAERYRAYDSATGAVLGQNGRRHRARIQ